MPSAGSTRIPEVGALAPAVADATGNRQYLCKRYPAVVDLVLRGFAPRLRAASVSRAVSRATKCATSSTPSAARRDRRAGHVGRVHARAARCDRSHRRLRSQVLSLLRGLRLERAAQRVARNAFVPSVSIVHHGGGAARKGCATSSGSSAADSSSTRSMAGGGCDCIGDRRHRRKRLHRTRLLQAGSGAGPRVAPVRPGRG